MANPIVLAISGASGVIYGKEVFKRLHEAGKEIKLIISPRAEIVLMDELDETVECFYEDGVEILPHDRFNVSIASGSYLTGGMIIAPCSMGMLGRIATGISTDLISRVADVHLKEGRKLILCPREMPLSAIHLENMLKLSHAGAVIMPPMPPLTSRPKTVQDMATILAGRIFDQLGIEQSFVPRYSGVGK